MGSLWRAERRQPPGLSFYPAADAARLATPLTPSPLWKTRAVCARLLLTMTAAAGYVLAHATVSRQHRFAHRSRHAPRAVRLPPHRSRHAPRAVRLPPQESGRHAERAYYFLSCRGTMEGEDVD